MRILIFVSNAKLSPTYLYLFIFLLAGTLCFEDNNMNLEISSQEIISKFSFYQ